MRNSVRQALVELHVSWLRRSAVAVLTVIAVGVGLAIVGGFNTARNADRQLAQTLEYATADGITLKDALAEPYSVAQSGGQTTVSNPLHYDYVTAVDSIRAISGGPIPVISAVTETVTFLFLPVALVFLGVSSATGDLRDKTMKLRAAGDGWGAITAGKLVIIPLAAAAGILFAALMGLIASLVIRGDMLGLSSGVSYDLTYAREGAPLILKLIFAWVMGIFFGVVGYALGAALRSRVWPTVGAAVILFAVPFLGWADPRNCLLALSSGVIDGWGAFSPNAPIPVARASALGVVAAWVVGAVAVAFLFPRPSRRYGK